MNDATNVISKETVFNFRAISASVAKRLQEEGKVVPEKRAAVVLQVPYPTVSHVMALAQSNQKVRGLIEDAIRAMVDQQVRAQLLDEETPVNSQEQLDLTKLDIVAISELTREARTAAPEVSKEEFEAFGASIARFLEEHNVCSTRACATMGECIAAKIPRKFRANIAVLNKIHTYVQTYLSSEATPKAELELHEQAANAIISILERAIRAGEEDTLGSMFD